MRIWRIQKIAARGRGRRAGGLHRFACAGHGPRAAARRGNPGLGQRAARMMVRRNYGRIINISSISQYRAAENRAHYCTSKGAIGMLTRCMALELAPRGVTVNSVIPGSIHTDLNRDVLANERYYAGCVQRIPMGRLGCAQDVVPPVLMFASEEAGYITGTAVAVDGGALAQ